VVVNRCSAGKAWARNSSGEKAAEVLEVPDLTHNCGRAIRRNLDDHPSGSNNGETKRCPHRVERYRAIGVEGKDPGPADVLRDGFCVVRFVKLMMSAPATICFTSAPFWLTKLIVYSPLITGWARNGNEQIPVKVRVGTGEGVRVTVSAIAAELMTTDAPIAQAAANSLFIGHPSSTSASS
jgi:hypothetical protein